MARPAWVDNSAPAVTAANLNAMTAADTTEAATNAALGGSATIDDNMNRIRAAISQIVAGNFTTGMTTLLTNAVQMLPLSQKGAASGVARLDSSKNSIVEAGQKLTAPGQTGAATGPSSVANQAVGAVQVSSGAVDLSQWTITNSLITATSHVIPVPYNIHGASVFVDRAIVVSVAAGSAVIEVRTSTGAATNNACDLIYFIVN